MNDERLNIPEGIPETKRDAAAAAHGVKEKKDRAPKATAEGSPEAGGEGGPPV